MIELFNNIPLEIKQLIIKFIDYVFDTVSEQKIPIIISNFAKECTIPEQAEFIDFYFHVKLEQLKNESDTNISEEPAR